MYRIELSEDHKYTVNNKPYPGVSEVLDFAAMVDKRFFTEESRRRGDYVHIETEKIDRGTRPEIVVPEWGGYIDAWQKFKDDFNIKIIDIEKKLFDPIYKFCGTLDRTAFINKEYFILDLKSGVPCEAHVAQLGGYYILDGEKADLACVYLKPNGMYALKGIDRQKAKYTFLAALGIWKQKESIKRKIDAF